MNNYDVIIAGAGIVGLATTYKLIEKKPGLKICVIEKEDSVSKHQTGNNSGVIHSGIYYKPGSLKATNCRRGYKMLLDFCDENGIPYDICGKVIVATNEEEIPRLDNLFEHGQQNGLQGLKELSSEEVKEIEPYVNAVKGIRVPETGIIDYLSVSEKLTELIKEKGVEIFFNEKLKQIIDNNSVSHFTSHVSQSYIEILTDKDNYSCKLLITCCGLQSDRVAKLNNKNLNVKIIPFRGEYYTIKKERRNLVKNLIYPVPDPQFPFLGVHFTRMLNGKVEAGPNAVFAFMREGYKKTDIDFSDLADSLFWKGFLSVALKYWKVGKGEFYRSYYKPAFVKALQKLLPDIQADDLEVGGAGIRAQACDIKGNLVDDFLFVENEKVIHVCNAPSPAATSSLSIGDTIAEKVISKM
ncbi:MAG: L-2-hydroxyglutarate oxidase [Ignavibacteria bacterium]|jgi:L-2-hydroxyglutarate oxidase